MRKASRPHAIREVSGPETRVSLGVALEIKLGSGGRGRGSGSVKFLSTTSPPHTVDSQAVTVAGEQ